MTSRNAGAVRKLLILGAGGTSVDILDFLDDINRAGPRYECVGFLDDKEALWGNRVHGVEVLGPLARATEFPEAWFADGLGSPSSFWRREEIVAHLGIQAERFETIVHPTARISTRSTLGRGGVVYPNVTVAANVSTGDHVTILSNSVINHDVSVAGYTIIASGVSISGLVRVGASCDLGTGSTIIERAAPGDGCLVGMGSLRLRDLPAGRLVAGGARSTARRRPFGHTENDICHRTFFTTQ